MWKWLAQRIMKFGGWTMHGGTPDIPKAVIIAAPHTSNWDGIWALTYKVAVGLPIRFFAKKSLFWFPLGILLRGLGGIPLDRSRATSAVDQAIAMFKKEETFYFGLSPEGTRSPKTSWKTGFYRIALGANVPVLLGVLDFRNREIGITGRIDLSGDMDADIEKIAAFYDGIEGRWPKNTTPVRFRQLGDKR